jgi:hypothetical protein
MAIAQAGALKEELIGPGYLREAAVAPETAPLTLGRIIIGGLYGLEVSVAVR